MKLAMASLIVVVVVACGGSKSDAPAAGSGSGSGSGSAQVVAAAVGSAVAPKPDPHAKRVVTPPTKAQLADYRKHLKAGWALQKQSKWAESVVELEKSLVAIDGDQRALTELGFSAANAGDFVKARRADEQAIQVSADKKMKAAALYNLGLVQEKTNDAAGALRSYVASLALRPNKTVEKAVGRLGTSASAAPPFCAKGAKPCDCVLAAAFGDFETDPPPTCEPAADIKPPVDGFHVYHVGRVFHMEDWNYLLDEHDQLVAIVKGGYEYRGGRVFDMVELDSATVQTVSGHKLLRIQTHEHLEETTIGATDDDMSVEHDEKTLVTICEIGGAATRCPLRDVPVAEEHEGKQGSKTVLDLAIAADGTATLKLVSGPSDEAIDNLVGPHKLW